MPKFPLLISTLIFMPLLASAQNYNLDDLRALAKEGSYKEFLDHAMDVRPSQRQDEWKKMVLEMANIYSKALLTQNTINKDDFTKIETIYSWPSIRPDELFSERRHEIGVKYLSSCLSQSTPCWDLVKSFWENDKHNPETAFKLAELNSKYSNSPIPTWDLIDVAVKSTLSEFYCKKEFIKEEVWKKLETIYTELGSQGDLLPKIDKLLHPACLGPINELAQYKLKTPTKNSDRELAFQLLKAQFKSTTLIEDLFYTIYLLEKPSQGELFNYSWNRVKLLSTLPKRRDQVIEQFKLLDPLPDEIFTSLDELKVRAIFNLMKLNFPELVDFYFNQCKAYYSGSKTFLDGNPTLNCKAFVTSKQAATLLDPELLNEFKVILKFK